jgi:hypothetical protein
MYAKETTSGRMFSMCYILCMIVGPPIRGFGGGVLEKKLGVYSPNFEVVSHLW